MNIDYYKKEFGEDDGIQFFFILNHLIELKFLFNRLRKQEKEN